MASITFTSNSYEGRKLRLVITQNQNIANNTSTLNWTLYSEGGTSDFYTVQPTTIKINGTQVYYKDITYWSSYAFPAAKGNTSGSITVTHNSDGSLTVPVVFTTHVYESGTVNYGGNFTLTKNPRGASINSAQDFNDEQNPTITYTNPLGNSIGGLQACLSWTGSNDDIAYRDIPKTGTSYTFNFTAAERKILRQGITNGNSRSIIFYIKSIISGVTYYSTATKILSLINYTPTIMPTVKDINQTTLALTEDANKLIKYYSNASFVNSATARKEATITSRSAVNGGVTKTSNSGTFANVENGTFTFYATDSRGNNSTATVTKTVIDYIKPTANIAVTIDAEGKTTIDINGIYFNNTFGAQHNSLSISYRYKEKNAGTYSNWIAAAAIEEPESYSLTVEMTGLNYQKTYVFQARAVDKLSSVLSEEITVVSIPVFDWDKNDFKFNVPLSVGGNISFQDGKQTAERSILFANTSGTYPHTVKVYGGNPNNANAFGVYDSRNGMSFIQYADTTKTLSIGGTASGAKVVARGDFSLSSDTDWTTINIGSGGSYVKYRRKCGIVYVVCNVTGAWTISNTYKTLATLPTEFRPSIEIPFTYNRLGTADSGQGAYVRTNGNIDLYNAVNATYFSFSVSFPV